MLEFFQGLFDCTTGFLSSSHHRLCSIYENQQGRFAVARPFMRIGLERGGECIYITADVRKTWFGTRCMRKPSMWSAWRPRLVLTLQGAAVSETWIV